VGRFSYTESQAIVLLLKNNCDKMACDIINLQTVQGDNWAWTATFVDDTDQPIDLSVYDDVQMEIRKKPNADVIASATLIGADFSVIGDDSNILSLDICYIPTDVQGVYQWDVQFVLGGNVETKIRGTLNILPEITQVYL
jgi:hypothetical protein